ncbi:hypothetical protein [Prochlorococcus marinus]|uniref:hypothetical protein n=1 Tax=Prochlorococcus marinus TaxID=1219 RepID=UPI0022B48581|nr:hypothetical protein [Prochlorococcus marinus]
MKKRWVLLEHTLLKDSLEGLHFDLLLEDANFCRTWRLESIPLPDGPHVGAIKTSPHQLYWLNRNESPVSGNRGWAKCVDRGFYYGYLPQNQDLSTSIRIQGNTLQGNLLLTNTFCQLFVSS